MQDLQNTARAKSRGHPLAETDPRPLPELVARFASLGKGPSRQQNCTVIVGAGQYVTCDFSVSRFYFSVGRF